MCPLVLIVSGEGCSRPTRRVLDVKHCPFLAFISSRLNPRVRRGFVGADICLIQEGREWSFPSGPPLCQPSHREWGRVSLSGIILSLFLTQFVDKILTSLSQDLPIQKFSWASRNLSHVACGPVCLSTAYSCFLTGPCCFPQRSCWRAEESSSVCSADPQSSVSLSLSLTQFLPLWCVLSHLQRRSPFLPHPPPLFPSPTWGKFLSFLLSGLIACHC